MTTSDITAKNFFTPTMCQMFCRQFVQKVDVKDKQFNVEIWINIDSANTKFMDERILDKLKLMFCFRDWILSC